jgi:hypothetical protein
MKVVVGLGGGSGVCGCVPPGIASVDSVGIAEWDCGVISSGTSSNRGSKEASERTSESITIGCKMLS